MANSNKKGKKKIRVDEPVDDSRDSRLGDPIDDSLSDSDMKVFSLFESNIDRLREQYHIPKQFQLFESGLDGLVSSSLLGQVTIYVEDLWTGLHFLISNFVRNLFDYYGLCPV